MHLEDEDEEGEEGGGASRSSHGLNSGKPRVPEPNTLEQLDEDEHDLEESLPSTLMEISRSATPQLRIPVKPAIDSETKPATHSDFIPASIPI